MIDLKETPIVMLVVGIHEMIDIFPLILKIVKFKLTIKTHLMSRQSIYRKKQNLIRSLRGYLIELVSHLGWQRELNWRGDKNLLEIKFRHFLLNLKFEIFLLSNHIRLFIGCFLEKPVTISNWHSLFWNMMSDDVYYPNSNFYIKSYRDKIYISIYNHW